MLLYKKDRFKGIVGKSFTAASFDEYLDELKLGTWKPQFIVLHNTWVPKLRDWPKTDGDTRMKNLAHYYATKKWSGGPHLFIADDLIWVFNPLDQRGTHSPSWNALSWGVEVVGDYETESFTGGVKKNTLSALTSMHEKLAIDPDTLRFHREDPLTDHNCPGKNILKAAVIQEIKSLLQSKPIRVYVDGQEIKAQAFLEKDRCFVALRPVATALGWELDVVSIDSAELKRGNEIARVSLDIREGTGYTPAAEMERLNCSVVWNHATKSIKLFKK